MHTTVQHDPYRASEEVLNAITHGIGCLLSIAGLVILVEGAASLGDALKIVCFSVYGASLIVLYAASTLFHGFANHRLVTRLQIFDHAAIYLLIAGS